MRFGALQQPQANSHRTRMTAALLLGLGLSACGDQRPDFIANKPLVELAVTVGDVWPLEVRAGMLHLEATCDVANDAVCGVAAAQWCGTEPHVYDQQRFKDGAQGEWRTVWRAQCSPRQT